MLPELPKLEFSSLSFFNASVVEPSSSQAGAAYAAVPNTMARDGEDASIEEGASRKSSLGGIVNSMRRGSPASGKTKSVLVQPAEPSSNQGGGEDSI